MADRLQKTLDVKPTVASVGSPSGPDMTTGDAVRALGSLATTYVAGKKQSDLNAKLKNLSDEVFAAEHGKQLENTTARFERIKAAHEQGLLTDDMKAIEAEKVLKEAIGNLPAFAPELRREAARKLGYDPTGAQVRFNMGQSQFRSSSSSKQSFAEKEMEKAIFWSSQLNIEPEVLLRQGAEATYWKGRADIAADRLRAGGSSRQEFLSEAMPHYASYVNEAVIEIAAEIKAGGVTNPEEWKARLLQGKNMAIRLHSSGVAGTPGSSTDLMNENKAISQMFDDAIKLVDDGTFENIATRQANSLAKSTEMLGAKTFPTIYALNKAGGQAFVTSYLEGIKHLTESQLQLMRKIDPTLEAIFSNKEALGNEMIKVFATIHGSPLEIGVDNRGNPVTVNPGEEVNQTLLDTMTKFIVEKETDKEVRKSAVKQLLAQGKPAKMLSIYAKPGVRSRATEDEVRAVTQEFKVNYPQLINNIAQLANEEGATIKVRNGKLVADRKRTRGARGYISSELDKNLRRLQVYSDLVDNGWAQDLDIDKNNFKQSVIQEIFDLKEEATKDAEADKLLREWESNPSEELLNRIRAIDPNLVSATEASAALADDTSQSTGGRSGANKGSDK